MDGLVRHILIKVLTMTKYRADLVFDTYSTPSIKDMTRDARGDDEEVVYNFGAAQKTPKNFEALLKLSSFKTEFLRFFLYFFTRICPFAWK